MDCKYLINHRITNELINSRLDAIKNDSQIGGHALFLGQVRGDKINNKTTKAIIYSAYEEMVAKEAMAIEKQIRDEFSQVLSVDILHSTGEVRAGEVSLLVIVSAKHRKQAFDAVAKTVDLIKEKLPVWKKETFDDGTARWI